MSARLANAVALLVVLGIPAAGLLVTMLVLWWREGDGT
jgi:hypothetical protein